MEYSVITTSTNKEKIDITQKLFINFVKTKTYLEKATVPNAKSWEENSPS